MRTFLGVLSVVTLVQAESVRERINFDFSWRHHLGDAPDAEKKEYNDSAWEVINAPHDMLIVQPYDKNASEKQAFIPRGVGWYRKHFRLPADWNSSAVWFSTDGIFHNTTLYLNGVEIERHIAGYTSFSIRLDTVSGVQFGDSENVLSIFADASSGTGWWYEGGGLMRHNYLLRAAEHHIATDGAWAYAQNVSVKGATATVVVSATAENSASVGAGFSASALLVAPSGSVVTKVVTTPEMTIAANGVATLQDIHLPLSEALLWSVQTPHLYTAVVELFVAGSLVDSVNITIGVRALRFDANDGLFVNDEHVKLRGFCDHSTFGGTGAAVADRVNLFRAQKLRSVGGNSWRMAHNPPAPERLDYMDRLGMLAVDENRDYGGQKQQGGTTNETVADELHDMRDLVKRDRSHPSVLVWSFCNEVGCNNESSAAAFRAVAKRWDPSRAVTQNRVLTDVSTDYLDVQGFSHKSTSVFESFHASHPEKPMLATECCSCMSQRGVDEDSCPSPMDGGCAKPPAPLPAGEFYNNNIGVCTAGQVAMSDAPDYVAGTFVWSAFDYLGEARGWPQNTKCRGTVADVVGFEKETAFWLKSWWLSNISRSDAGRPLDVEADTPWTVFIIESWTPPAVGTTRSIHVYTNAPTVRLELNGKTVATTSVAYFGMATFDKVTYEAGTLTAFAVSAAGEDVQQHSIMTTGVVAKVVLSLDAPSVTTGTGSAILADGEDTAMVRATLVDAKGEMVTQASNTVTFRVVSGAGQIWATHNGGPANLSPSHAAWTPAYMGLARAFVRSTTDQATPVAHRWRMLEIDSDPNPTVKIVRPDVPQAVEDIVVEALVDGIPSAQITIHVSDDLAHSPLNVAAASFKEN